MNKDACFKIRLLSFDSKADIFDIVKGSKVMDVPCLNPYYKPNPTIIVADPFLFVKDKRLFLFYEEKGLCTPGVLNMTSTTDLKEWTKPVTILQEPFHLSFPWVFEEDGTVYMIPETGKDGSVRLYKADNDGLTRFSLLKRLITEPKDRQVTMGYGDSCIVKKEGTYYLFTMLQYEDKVNTLELYTSNQLAGEYVQHPQSPIVKSQKTGRNAGCILKMDGRLVRPSQDCTNRYGDNVHLSEITTLTPTTYGEQLIRENIIPTSIPFYKEGGHQWNVVPFLGKWIVATDAKEYHWLLAQKVVRRLRKIVPL